MAVLNQRRELPSWSDYTRFLRRHRAGIVALSALGLLAGITWSLLQPVTYSATASVALAQVPVYVAPTSSELVPPEVSIDTDAQLLNSPRVRGAVAAVLDTNPDQALGHLSVTATPHSQVLHVTVTASSPERASRAANAAVAALIDVRRKTLGAFKRSQLRQLRFVLSQQERELAQEQARRMVDFQQDQMFARILELRDSLTEIRQARAVPAEVVRPAQPPTDGDYANTEVPVTSGAMVGLLCGCLLGLARDRAPRLDPLDPGPSVHPTRSGYLPDATTREEDYHHAV